MIIDEQIYSIIIFLEIFGKRKFQIFFRVAYFI